MPGPFPTPRALPAAGVLVPPANPTVEPEMRALLGEVATLHTARLPYLPHLPLRDRLAAYWDATRASLESFGTIPLRAAIFACTGSSYLHGPDADAAVCADITASSGVRFCTAATAVLQTLRTHGVSSVTLVSPYPDWLTDLAAAFWSQAGIGVRHVIRVNGDGSIYDLSSDAVTDALRRCVPARHGALLLAGTGMPTLAAINELAPRWPHPVLSSATCSARWLKQALTPKDDSRGT